MNKLAIAALSQWDEPDMFDDESLYLQVNSLVSAITHHSGNIELMDTSYFALLARLLAGSIDATKSAIDSAKDDIKIELIHTLEALWDASNELEHIA